MPSGVPPPTRPSAADRLAAAVFIGQASGVLRRSVEWLRLALRQAAMLGVEPAVRCGGRSRGPGTDRSCPSAQHSHRRNTKPPRIGAIRGALPGMNIPATTYFPREVAPRVSSALESLTSVFGMGTGVTSPLASPG